AVIANAAGPSDLRTGGRAQTGSFTEVPGLPAGFRRVDLVGVTVVQAPDLASLLSWGASFVPGVLATEALTDPALPAEDLVTVGSASVTASGRMAQRTWSAGQGRPGRS